MKIIALLLDTLREIYAKKVIIGIIVIEVIVLLITGLILFSSGMQENFERLARNSRQLDTVAAAERPTDSASQRDVDVLNEIGGDSGAVGETIPRSSSRTFESPADTVRPEVREARGELVLAEAVKGPMSAFAVVLIGAALFMGIFATAGIVPSMMEKGTIDLLLSKPLPRSALLLGRALGGVAAFALNLLFFVLGVYALYGLATGVWHVPFVTWTFSITLFAFLVLYCGIIMMNVTTEGWILPMIVSYLHMTVLSAFLTNRETTLYTFIDSDLLRSIIDGLYYVLPQINDLIQGLGNAVYTDTAPPIEPIIQCSLFALAMIGIAMWRFERKDF